MGGDRTSYLTRSPRERAFRYSGGPPTGHFALSEFANLQMKFRRWLLGVENLLL
jgi:hypothetical protein